MNSERQFVVRQLVWLSISIAISIILSMLFPFYISLPLMIAAFIGINYYMRRRMMKRMGMNMQSMFGGNRSINFYCMSCGNKHNSATCPNCGSKMKRAGF